MLNDQTSDENDPEAEDAVIRANAARKMHTAQTMNISTLVGYGKQQQQQMINESLDIKMLPPGVPSGMTPMFTGQNTMSLPPEMPPNMLMIGFNPSQPPPPLLMPMMMPPGMITPPAQTPSQASAAATSLRQQPTVMSVPSSVRPFSLDAVTAPLSRDVQRQLARDAFMRILDGLEAPYTRAQPAGAYLIILVDRAIKNLSYGFELLSKLLMQEYCRFRGFQLAGFSRFMDSRRHQLSVSREVRCKRLESSIENGSDDNNKSMLSDTNGDAANTDASDNHEKTTEEDIRRQDMSTDEISHGGEKHKKKSNNTSDNTKRKLLDNSSMKPKCTDDEEPNEEEESDEDDAVADKADGDEETKSSLSNSSSLKDTPRRQSKKPKEEVSGDLKLSSKDKLSILKAPVAPPDDLGCLSFYDYIFIEVLQKLSNPEIRPR
ncbi:unnamed protein product [Trichobilharzia regenti]|nr:unnamed protein product [Trichobilharzia regenti]